MKTAALLRADHQLSPARPEAPPQYLHQSRRGLWPGLNVERQNSDGFLTGLNSVGSGCGWNDVGTASVEIGRSHNSVSREIEKPGERQRNWKPQHDQQYSEAHHPIRDVENGKDLSNALSERPPTDTIGD